MIRYMKKNWKVLVFLFFAVYLSSLFHKYKKLNNQITNFERFKFEMSNLWHERMFGKSEEDGSRQYLTSDFGDFAYILEYTDQLSNLSDKIFNKITSSASCFEDMTSSEKLCLYSHLLKSRVNLERFEKTLSEGELQLNEFISDYKNKMELVSFDNLSNKDLVLKVIDRDGSGWFSLFSNFISLERESIFTLYELFDFFFEIYGSYDHVEGGLVFENESDRERFDLINQCIGDIEAREDEILRQMEEYQQSNYEKCVSFLENEG